MSNFPRSLSTGTFRRDLATKENSLLSGSSVLKNIIQIPKQLYRTFNEFALEESRLMKISEFVAMTEQIKKFNQQIIAWKQQRVPIKNVRLTYHFYENLYTRIKYISSFSTDPESARRSLVDVVKWFGTEKAKVRGSAPKKPQTAMKPYSENKEETTYLNDLTEESALRRQMTPYEKMARTAHTNFFPPKERLVDYHKKQFVLDARLTIDGDEAREKRLSKTSSLKNRTSSKFKSKMGKTTTSLKNTTGTNFQTNLDSQSNANKMRRPSQASGDAVQKDNQAAVLDEVKEIQIQQFRLEGRTDAAQQGQTQQQLEEINLTKKGEQNLQKEEIAKDLIDEPEFEEDIVGQEERDLIEEEVEQPEKYSKAYQYEHLASEREAAEQTAKEAKKSTLRRILKDNEAQMSRKMEDLNLKKNMISWGKEKSIGSTHINRRLESYKVSNYKNIEYAKKPTHFQRKKQIPEYNYASARSKTAQTPSRKVNIEFDIQKRKINETIQKYGKYILPHVSKIQQQISQTNEKNQQEAKLMRATSLTAFNFKISRKKHFGDLLESNRAEIYNEEAQEQVTKIKNKLSKKTLKTDAKRTMRALSTAQPEDFTGSSVRVFPQTLTLLSNPYFPKTKAKKKKKA